MVARQANVVLGVCVLVLMAAAGARAQETNIAAADFDGNGGLDLAVTNGSRDSVSVLYNTVPEPATLALVVVGLSALVVRRRRP